MVQICACIIILNNPRNEDDGETSQNLRDREGYREEGDEEDLSFNRDFYDAEESETVGDSASGSFVGINSHVFLVLKSSGDEKKAEERVKSRLPANIRARHAAYETENSKWERNRMLTSGAVKQGNVETEFDDDLETRLVLFSTFLDNIRVHILVHDIKPPFLDGRVVYTKQQKPVQPIRDPTSDMAILSKKGEF